jgi:glycosyltransferase involved in cell wall biosynthesis
MKKTKLPLVSVIIPAYNHHDYVREALLSALNQDYPHLEIIVVDDGSTDATPDIVENELSLTKKPHRFIKQANQGVHGALHTGIGAAGGEFISILNSDDVYHAGRVSKFVAIARETGAEFLFSKLRYVGKDGESLPQSSPFVRAYRDSLDASDIFPTKSFELLRYNYTVSSSNFFFSKKLHDTIGGFRNYKLCHDWDFVLKALIYSEPFFVNEFLMSYRIHGKNVILIESKNRTNEIETESVLFSYFQMAENPQNGLAPCWVNWGRYWSYFVRKYLHFAFYFETSTPFLL